MATRCQEAASGEHAVSCYLAASGPRLPAPMEAAAGVGDLVLRQLHSRLVCALPSVEA